VEETEIVEEAAAEETAEEVTEETEETESAEPETVEEIEEFRRNHRRAGRRAGTGTVRTDRTCHAGLHGEELLQKAHAAGDDPKVN